MGTTITPEHDSGFCHAASENRRRILEQLKDLASQLENCEIDAKQSLGEQSGACSSPCAYPCGNPDCEPCAPPADKGSGTHTNHQYKYRYKKPDPVKGPLVVYPDYLPHHYRPRTPPYRLTFETGRRNSKSIIGSSMVSVCDCTRRNGLQDQCKKTDCRGKPECLTKPEPTCLPSKGYKLKDKDKIYKAIPEKELLIAMGIMNDNDDVPDYNENFNYNYECNLPESNYNNNNNYKTPERNNIALEVCCKCPSDCWEQKQRKQRTQEQYYEPQQNEQNESRYNSPQYAVCCSHPNSNETRKPEVRQRREGIKGCDQQVFKGQFCKTLQTMETDPCRGPLMNR